MYSCMAKAKSMAIAYFCSYVFFVTVVLASLFVSLVFQLYADIENQRRTGALL